MIPSSVFPSAGTGKAPTAVTPLVLLVLCSLLLAGCNRVRDRYFAALEKVGIEKRELLVSRVDNARQAQQKAQEQFQDALEEFQSVVDYDGGELEKVYKRVSAAYDKSKERADEVHERIRKVENVARSLFDEWHREIDLYNDSSLQRESEKELEATRERYQQLVVVMKDATRPMEPVLEKLNDQVLFLKHNLNARALGSLQGTVQELEVDVAALVAEMQVSIAEADAFISEMKARNQST